MAKGKMSQEVSEEDENKRWKLRNITQDLPRVFLVEAFNWILISNIIPNNPFDCGIQVFKEKEDLLSFKEAKRYRHNAAYALILYIRKTHYYFSFSCKRNY